ncbi:MAG: 23S rRNA (adenine(2030)-N(6))-methyltransferase RlmJ [Alphaproteobacteria bacterium]|nr:23S rRNA (adenine(2030)-N(6))-methyltransferase RlmJ [Alphaproteobacteria bacterium]
MLSYQHIYHAGGWFDVHKHAVLCALWQKMAGAGDSPLTFVDTHAGRGVYDLSAPEARKIAEYETGIGRLDPARLPPPFAPYVYALRQWKPYYPGSAGCIAALKNPSDSMVLYEKHPGEIQFLQGALGRMPNISIVQEDGHEGALAQAGGGETLVVIDPSYEVKTEYQETAETVRALLAKAPETKILVWYPVLAGGTRQEVLQAGWDDLETQPLCLEITAPLFPAPDKGMVRSGLLLFNAPAGFEKTATAITEILARVLKSPVTKTKKTG